MKSATLLMCAMLTGCAASVAEVPPAELLALPPVAPIPHRAPPDPTVVVVRHFDKIKVRELDVVVSAVVTASQIDHIRIADQAARDALRVLIKQRDAVTRAALETARVRVAALEQALNEAVTP